MSDRPEKLHGANTVMMEAEHYNVHDGNMYHVSYYDSISAGNIRNMLIVTGAREPHIKFGIQTGAKAKIQLLEGVTTSANGTSITVWNMKRDSSMTSTAVFFSEPTWSTNTEKILSTQLIGGSTNRQNLVGGETRNGIEWILKHTTTGIKYLLQITNLATDSTTVGMVAEFYEI